MEFKLPGKNCGMCGYSSCKEFQDTLDNLTNSVESCVFYQKPITTEEYLDSLGREYDFVLDKLPEDEGPRETIHPFNFESAKDLKIGDIIGGRPQAAGCPLAHIGRIININYKSGLIDWIVTGPLSIREQEIPDIGSYIPIAFYGIIKKTKVELKVGMRYNWLPRRCMVQWRHSGLISYISKCEDGYLVRIEGVFLG